MKKLTSLIVLTICFAFIGNLLSTKTAAQQISSGTQILSGKNTVQDEPPVRDPAQVEVFRKLIRQAIINGTAEAIVVAHNMVDRDELMRQLAPFQVRVISLYEIFPFVTLEADAAAFIYMRDSHLVKGVEENSIFTFSVLPDRSPEELAYLYGLIAKAQAAGTVRVMVRLKMNFTPEENLTPNQSAAQREALAVIQSEVLRSLVPYRATLVKQFEDVPYLALDVDASAINLMIYSPLVVRIRENRVKIQIQKGKKKY